MELQQMVTELERRCPGVSFQVEPGRVRIVEYGRKFVVDLEELQETPKQWFETELERHPADDIPPLEPDEKYRVLCSRCGSVVIGYGGYFDQMHKPDSPWYCPNCGETVRFDDETYESFLNGGRNDG